MNVRTDIQALRAVAVGLVVLFHTWPGLVSGGYVGVDVFFVISGYLITGQLVRSAPSTVGDLARFWVRRIRRLLPAALLVLATTLVAVRLVGPVTMWSRTAKETGAAALYVENWYLARASIGYLTAGNVPTAVQHFWSLSVEEQFYVVWPVLVFAATVLGRRRRGVLLAALSVVGVASFVESVRLTAAAADEAYVVTSTRVWELAVGGVLAAATVHRASVAASPSTRPTASQTRWPSWWRPVAAWAGLAVVVASALLFSSSTAFPGAIAAVPVLATAVVLAAHASGRCSPPWTVPGAQWLGSVSYSFYLWHWPAIVVGGYLVGGRLTGFGLAVAVALAGGLAHVTKRGVEDRFRVSHDRPASAMRTVVAAAAGMALVTGASVGVLLEVRSMRVDARAEVAAALAEGDPCLGAPAALSSSCSTPSRTIPALVVAAEDRSDAFGDSCFVDRPFTSRRTCTFGDGPTHVALIGNSHAGHWLPALQVIAAERDWTITTYLVSTCNITDAPLEVFPLDQSAACTATAEWVRQQLIATDIDLVIESERQAVHVVGTDWVGTIDAATAAYASFVQPVLDAGRRLIVIQDNVAPPVDAADVPECLALAGSPAECDWPLDVPPPRTDDDARWSDPLAAAVRSLDDPAAQVISLDDVLCPQRVCRAVIGGVVTYFDDEHLTATFARTAAPILGDRIDAALAAMDAAT